MQTTQEQWLSLKEIAQQYDIQPNKVTTIIMRHRLEVRTELKDRRKKYIRVADFQRAVESESQL